MTRRILTGNDAVGLGALRASVRVVTGYPGTPSTEALASLLAQDLPGRHVEWSTNEKVAFEIAAGAAWAGRRALCTMKMSGLNVAYDAVVSIAYSGTNAGLVVYVADDPGVSAGMPEQDTRGFALMTDVPMLEPSSVEEAYRLTQTAFELSEAIGGLVFVRLTTAIALTHAVVDVAPGEAPGGATAGGVSPGEAPGRRAGLAESGDPILERNIAKYTKAGAAICLAQHEQLLVRLARAEEWLHERGLHRLMLGKKGGVGIVVVGPPAAYIEEALAAAGLGDAEVSVLHAASTLPFPAAEVRELLAHCGSVLVVEELEPHFERALVLEAHRAGFPGRIVGKLDGTPSRSGEYTHEEVMRGLAAATAPGRLPGASGLGEPSATILPSTALPAPRPITVCAGCPHRGTYMAIEAAIRKARLRKDEVMVTGDIGCTILGMNPPFDLLWNEVSMGSSVSLAQGYVHAGIKTPVIATIGDSTFFHGGIPGVLNAVQHRVPLIVVVMDNGWTGMTGMQVNPGTAEAEQKGGRRIDLAELIPALGVDRFAVSDPFDLAATTQILTEFLKEPSGVRVLLARRECAIQAGRRGVREAAVRVDHAKCVLCKRCIQVTGCPALGCSAMGVAEQLGANRKGKGDSPGSVARDALGCPAGGGAEQLGSKRESASTGATVDASRTGTESGQENPPGGGSSQAVSIAIDAALCNGCGLCAAVCPTSALARPTIGGGDDTR